MSEALAVQEPGSIKRATATSVSSRLDSIDLLRGLVMVLMALDHTRDYFTDVRSYPPENIYASSFALFMTRWITHFCAPTFIFLAGTAAFLYGTRVRSKMQLSWFLLSRGMWLVILELTWVRWSWNFTFDFLNNAGPVIWAIGWSMVFLSVLVFMPSLAVALVGMVMIAGHNYFDKLEPFDFGSLDWLWRILHYGGQLKPIGPIQIDGLKPIGPIQFTAAYPLIPWIGVMATGYGFGQFFLLERAERRRWFLLIGLCLTAGFFVLRYNNDYGDARKWSAPSELEMAAVTQQAQENNFLIPQRQMSDAEFTFCSFLNCTKYPPSLLYLLMTLGPAIAALALFDREAGPIGRFFVVFGRVPLFYYILHLPFIHGLMVLCDLIRYQRSPYSGESFWGMHPSKLPAGYGYSLPVVYLVWIGVVLMLYPVCRWYGDFKRRNRSAWLSYL